MGDIPIEGQTLVLTPIMAYALDKDPENLGQILSELIKGHRVKTVAVQESVLATMGGSRDKHGILREMAFNIFPKGPHSEWGWSRIGWSWQQWWMIVTNTIGTLEGTSAFDEIVLLLERIEAKGGTKLVKQPLVWNENRLTKAREILCKYGGL